MALSVEHQNKIPQQLMLEEPDDIFVKDPYGLRDLDSLLHKYFWKLVGLRVDVREDRLKRSFEKLDWVLENARRGVGILYENAGIGESARDLINGVAMADLIHTALLARQGGGKEILEKLEVIKSWAIKAQETPGEDVQSIEGVKEVEKLLSFTRSYPDWFQHWK